MGALCEAGDIGVDGFMCPGHVSVIIGAKAYEPLSKQYKVPCVVTGFEPWDMLHGIEMLLLQIAEGQSKVEIQYARSVDWEGNEQAQAIIDEIFEPCDTEWRGLGVLPASGLKIREKYSAHDAEIQFDKIDMPEAKENPGCICGEILRGIKTPHDCLLFNAVCTPDSPVGACMVSSEGTCAAYYKFARKKEEDT